MDEKKNNPLAKLVSSAYTHPGLGRTLDGIARSKDSKKSGDTSRKASSLDGVTDSGERETPSEAMRAWVRETWEDVGGPFMVYAAIQAPGLEPSRTVFLLSHGCAADEADLEYIVFTGNDLHPIIEHYNKRQFIGLAQKIPYDWVLGCRRVDDAELEKYFPFPDHQELD